MGERDDGVCLPTTAVRDREARDRSVNIPRCKKQSRTGQLKCMDCELGRPKAANCIGGSGPKGGVMIIGEFTVQGDARHEKPLTGRNGLKLDFLLEQVGLSRDRVYITSAINCALGAGKKKPKKIHISACKTHTRRDTVGTPQGDTDPR